MAICKTCATTRHQAFVEVMKTKETKKDDSYVITLNDSEDVINLEWVSTITYTTYDKKKFSLPIIILKKGLLTRNNNILTFFIPPMVNESYLASITTPETWCRNMNEIVK